MTHMRTRVVLALVLTAGLLAGCGSGHLLSGSARTTTTAPGASAATATASTVIRGWSRALRSGNVQAAARFFAHPSIFANGPDVLVIHGERQAVLANASLSCGAKVVSITSYGTYYHAVFRLTNRPGLGGGCGTGVGQEGATDFIINHGLIFHWIRAPITERKPSPQPANPQTPGQQV